MPEFQPVLTWHTDLAAYSSYYPEVRLGALIAILTLLQLSTSSNKRKLEFSQQAVTRRLLYLPSILLSFRRPKFTVNFETWTALDMSLSSEPYVAANVFLLIPSRHSKRSEASEVRKSFSL